MTKKSNGGKFIAVIILALVAAAAGYGYFNQSAKMTDPAAATPTIDADLLKPKPNDIILGDMNALVTIVEYSSLSCPHCAHFHETVLPQLQKEFITTGKVKLVLRHFPLNEPALKAAELVECAGGVGTQRSEFAKTLFAMQPQWAMGDDFLKQLKQIALLGGVDSAAFESCMADKDLETRIVLTRQEATEKLGVNATPSFFINGTKFEGEVSIEGFRKAINDASAAKQ